jgi:hypothetical protein
MGKVNGELKAFRELRDRAREPKELVPYLTDDLLEESGFSLHSQFADFSAGTKIVKGAEYEIRISRLNQSIGGTCTPGARDPDTWRKRAADSLERILQGDDPLPPIASVRTTQEIGWRELVDIV